MSGAAFQLKDTNGNDIFPNYKYPDREAYTGDLNALTADGHYYASAENVTTEKNYPITSEFCMIDVTWKARLSDPANPQNTDTIVQRIETKSGVVYQRITDSITLNTSTTPPTVTPVWSSSWEIKFGKTVKVQSDSTDDCFFVSDNSDNKVSFGIGGFSGNRGIYDSQISKWMIYRNGTDETVCIPSAINTEGHFYFDNLLQTDERDIYFGNDLTEGASENPHKVSIYGGNPDSATAIGIWDNQNSRRVLSYADSSNTIYIGNPKTCNLNFQGVATFANEATIPNLYDLRRGIAISTSDDLNNYKTIGVYYSANSTISTSLLNCPHKSSNFKLVVETMGATGYIRQRIIALGRDYIRYWDGSSWSKWGSALDTVTGMTFPFSSSTTVAILKNLATGYNIYPMPGCVDINDLGTNLNNLTYSGFYYWRGTQPTNAPGTWRFLLNIRYDPRVVQLCMSYISNNIQYRYNDGDGWTSWAALKFA